MKIIAGLLISATIIFLFFIWVLCRACSIAEERENFDDSYL